MINYLKIKKSRRANILDRNIEELPDGQGRDIQDLAIGLMERAPERIDYTHALEILMELGWNEAQRYADD